MPINNPDGTMEQKFKFTVEGADDARQSIESVKIASSDMQDIDVSVAVDSVSELSDSMERSASEATEFQRTMEQTGSEVQDMVRDFTNLMSCMESIDFLHMSDSDMLALARGLGTPGILSVRRELASRVEDLEFIPDRHGFANESSYYRSLENQYRQVTHLMNQLNDSDDELRRLQVAANNLQSRMSQSRDRSSEQNIISENQRVARERRRVHDIDVAHYQALQMNARRNNQQRQREEREQYNLDRAHYMALQEDRRRTRQLQQQRQRDINNTLDNLGKTFVYLNQGLQFARQLYGYSIQLTNFYDGYTNSNARLNYINDGQYSDLKLQSVVSDLASDVRLQYSETANLVSRFMMSGAFSSTDEVMRFTESIAKSFRVSGASAQETSGAIRQLTQSLSKGKLDGEEFNSVMEHSPLFAKYLGIYMGMTKGELLDARQSGLITIDAIKGAVALMTEEVDNAFEEMPKTFADLRVEIENEFGQFLTTTEAGKEFMNGLFEAFEEFISYMKSSEGQKTLTELTDMTKNLFELGVGFVKVAGPVVEMMAQNPEATLLGYTALKGATFLLRTDLPLAASNLTTALTSLKTTMLAFCTNPYILALLGITTIGALSYNTVKSANYDRASLAYDGKNSDMLMKEGYSKSEASELEKLYAERNMIKSQLLSWQGESYEYIPYLSGVEYNPMKSNDDYSARYAEYQALNAKIEQMSYLDHSQTQDKLNIIAEYTKQTAENTKEDNFIKRLQSELRYSQQAKTISQIEIKVSGANEVDTDLGKQIADILKLELDLGTAY